MHGRPDVPHLRAALCMFQPGCPSLSSLPAGGGGTTALTAYTPAQTFAICQREGEETTNQAVFMAMVAQVAEPAQVQPQPNRQHTPESTSTVDIWRDPTCVQLVRTGIITQAVDPREANRMARRAKSYLWERDQLTRLMPDGSKVWSEFREDGKLAAHWGTAKYLGPGSWPQCFEATFEDNTTWRYTLEQLKRLPEEETEEYRLRQQRKAAAKQLKAANPDGANRGAGRGGRGGRGAAPGRGPGPARNRSVSPAASGAAGRGNDYHRMGRGHAPSGVPAGAAPAATVEATNQPAACSCGGGGSALSAPCWPWASRPGTCPAGGRWRPLQTWRQYWRL